MLLMQRMAFVCVILLSLLSTYLLSSTVGRCQGSVGSSTGYEAYLIDQTCGVRNESQDEGIRKYAYSPRCINCSRRFVYCCTADGH